MSLKKATILMTSIIVFFIFLFCLFLLNVERDQDNLSKSTYTIKQTLISGNVRTRTYSLPTDSRFSIRSSRGTYSARYSYECGRWWSNTCSRILGYGIISLDDIRRKD